MGFVIGKIKDVTKKVNFSMPQSEGTAPRKMRFTGNVFVKDFYGNPRQAPKNAGLRYGNDTLPSVS